MSYGVVSEVSMPYTKKDFAGTFGNRSFVDVLSAWLQTSIVKFVPAFGWLRAYSTEDLVADFIAGLTVGFFIVPQVGWVLCLHACDTPLSTL